MAIAGDALKAIITANIAVLPTRDELLFVLLLPPGACLLKLITAMKLKLCCYELNNVLLCGAHHGMLLLGAGGISTWPIGHLLLTTVHSPGLATLHRHRSRDGAGGPSLEKGGATDSRVGGRQATREGTVARRETKGRRASAASCEARDPGGV
uniref:Uncharacterized protein n=1 Tax=Oryza meridionalis TaxID=40149 RepID=A0A0E0EW73_9ORYZ